MKKFLVIAGLFLINNAIVMAVYACSYPDYDVRTGVLNVPAANVIDTQAKTSTPHKATFVNEQGDFKLKSYDKIDCTKSQFSPFDLEICQRVVK